MLEEFEKLNRMDIFRTLLQIGLLIFASVLLYFGQFSSLSWTDSSFLDGTGSFSNFTISYEDLTIDEINKVNKIMGEVKPKYLVHQKEIRFVMDIKPHCSDCIGVNIENGKLIVIDYPFLESSETLLKRTICHELLHSYITDLDRDDEESIVYDLAAHQPCFYDGGFEK